MADEQQTPECKWLGISLRQPDAFDFNNAASWPTWKTRYEDYAAVSGVCHASAEVQVRSLLYCMGPESRHLLDTFSLSADELLSYKTVVKRFTEHFVHPANELYESSRFHKRTQERGESVDAYYAELCTLVKRCSYLSVQVEERLVRDRFVVGLRDARLSEQFCRNSKLSLKEAWTQARQWEDAEKEKTAKGTVGGFPPVELDAAKAHKAPRRPKGRQRALRRGRCEQMECWSGWFESGRWPACAARYSRGERAGIGVCRPVTAVKSNGSKYSS
ncbi:uncharacterized protein LOC144168100 [Haemaphysalis longicornis]